MEARFILLADELSSRPRSMLWRACNHLGIRVRMAGQDSAGRYYGDAFMGTLYGRESLYGASVELVLAKAIVLAVHARMGSMARMRREIGIAESDLGLVMWTEEPAVLSELAMVGDGVPHARELRDQARALGLPLP